MNISGDEFEWDPLFEGLVAPHDEIEIYHDNVSIISPITDNSLASSPSSSSTTMENTSSAAEETIADSSYCTSKQKIVVPSFGEFSLSSSTEDLLIVAGAKNCLLQFYQNGSALQHNLFQQLQFYTRENLQSQPTITNNDCSKEKKKKESPKVLKAKNIASSTKSFFQHELLFKKDARAAPKNAPLVQLMKRLEFDKVLDNLRIDGKHSEWETWGIFLHNNTKYISLYTLLTHLELYILNQPFRSMFKEKANEGHEQNPSNIMEYASPSTETMPKLVANEDSESDEDPESPIRRKRTWFDGSDPNKLTKYDKPSDDEDDGHHDHQTQSGKIPHRQANNTGQLRGTGTKPTFVRKQRGGTTGGKTKNNSNDNCSGDVCDLSSDKNDVDGTMSKYASEDGIASALETLSLTYDDHPRLTDSADPRKDFQSVRLPLCDDELEFKINKLLLDNSMEGIDSAFSKSTLSEIEENVNDDSTTKGSGNIVQPDSVTPPHHDLTRFRNLSETDKYRFICPISLTVMEDPVTTEDGFNYDREQINKWFLQQHRLGVPITSPVTGLSLKTSTLIPNTSLSQEIQEFKVANSHIALSDIHFGLSSGIFNNFDDISKLIPDLPVPNIIVLGNESHGKSSILERIIGLPIFPHGKGLCTRCIIRVNVQRCSVKEARPAEISVMNRIDKTVIPGSTCIVALDNIREAINEIMNNLQYANPSKAIIDDKEIVVNLLLPYSANITILDLPGLVAVNTDDDEVQASATNLAMSVLEEYKTNSMFVLVNDIKQTCNTSVCCAIVKNAGIQDKTVGIFTKLDTFSSEEGDEIQELREIIECTTKSSFPLRYGWCATSSRRSNLETSCSVVEESESVKEIKYLNAMDATEDDLIKRRFPELVDTQHVGIRSLRQKLQSFYESFIANAWVPRIIANVQPLLVELEKRIVDMGLPLARCPQYEPYRSQLSCGESQLTVQVLQDFLTERINFVLSSKSSLLSFTSERDFWGSIMLYCNFLTWGKVDGAVPFNITNINKYGSTTTRDLMTAQYFKSPHDAKGWIVKQHDICEAQHSIVEELMSSLTKICGLLKRKSKGMITSFMGIVNQAHSESTIEKFDRFTAIQQYLRSIVERQVDLIINELMTFFKSHVQKFFEFDSMTSSYNEVFAIEYFYDDSDVWACLHIKNLIDLQELPHLLLHKWSELTRCHVREMLHLIKISEAMLEIEDCQTSRVEAMESFGRYQSVEIEFRRFAARLEGKPNPFQIV